MYVHEAYPEGFSCLALSASLLDLAPPHLLLELTLPNAAVVLKSKQNVESRQLLQLIVIFPFVRFFFSFFCASLPLLRHFYFRSI